MAHHRYNRLERLRRGLGSATAGQKAGAVSGVPDLGRDRPHDTSDALGRLRKCVMLVIE